MRDPHDSSVFAAGTGPSPIPSPPLRINDACTACGACLLTCPERALRPDRGKPRVVAEACTACGECVEICPADAIDLLR